MDNTLMDLRRGSTGDRLPPGPTITSPITIHYRIQDHATRMQKLTKAFKVYRLTVLTLICVLTSVPIGLFIRPYSKDWTERQFMYVEFPGELYLRLLKLIIIPLLVSNVILSFGTMSRELFSHLGKMASFFYLGSNLLAISLAIALALLICPGYNLQPPGSGDAQSDESKEGISIDILDQSQIQNNHNNNNNNNINNDRNNRDNSNNNNKAPKIIIQMDSTQYYFNEYHDSMKRYRDFHPMVYHNEKITGDGEHQRQIKAPSCSIHSSTHQFIPYHEPKPQLEPPAQTKQRLLNRKPILTQSETKLPTGSSDPFEGLPKAQEPIKELKEETASTINEPVLQPPVAKYPVGSGSSNLSLMSEEHRFAGLSTKLPVDVLLDVLRNLVPDSLIGATLKQTRTRLFAPKELIVTMDGQTDPPPSRWPMGHELVEQANVIGLLACSVLTGVLLSRMQEAGRPILDLCACVSELSLRIGMIAIHLSPFCIMFLIIGQLARTSDLSSVAGELLMYSITVMMGLLVHGFILLPLIYYLVTRRSPIKFLCNMHEALVASFATSSSSASMAMMLKCLQRSRLNPVIVGAFGPVGAVFNMNGTAIYEAIGAIFIAQTLRISLPPTSLLLVGFSSAVASFSTSGIPSSGLMTMVIVLNAVNLPVLQLSLIYIVDFIIDRFRTVVNVWSGSIVCALIDHICPAHLLLVEDQVNRNRHQQHQEVEEKSGRQELIKDTDSCANYLMSGARRKAPARRQPSSGINCQQQTSKPRVISVTITPPTENSYI